MRTPYPRLYRQARAGLGTTTKKPGKTPAGSSGKQSTSTSTPHTHAAYTVGNPFGRDAGFLCLAVEVGCTHRWEKTKGAAPQPNTRYLPVHPHVHYSAIRQEQTHERFPSQKALPRCLLGTCLSGRIKELHAWNRAHVTTFSAKRRQKIRVTFQKQNLCHYVRLEMHVSTVPSDFENPTPP